MYLLRQFLTLLLLIIVDIIYSSVRFYAKRLYSCNGSCIYLCYCCCTVQEDNLITKGASLDKYYTGHFIRKKKCFQFKKVRSLIMYRLTYLLRKQPKRTLNLKLQSYTRQRDRLRTTVRYLCKRHHIYM